MDAPFHLADGRLQARLLACVDVEDKIPRSLAALGSLSGRRTLLLGAGPGSFRARQLELLGANVTVWPDLAGPPAADGAPFDVAVAWWDGFRGTGADAIAPLATVPRVLAPGARLLVVQDYGRDEVSPLYGDPDREARLKAWSQRTGPILGAGFKVRALHCRWTFPDLPAAADLLHRAFPSTGAAIAASMARPRLDYRVAVYHRIVGNRRATA
ncbi:MAG TPA: hypothetical protein VMH24_05550 [Candidatus Sulfotelmatobacter sp.]|nr:hypothetical protein [Candidatus Sulfotelmatobacter sp.]